MFGTAFVELPQQRKGPQTFFKKRGGNEHTKYGVICQGVRCKGELECSTLSLLSDYFLSSVFLFSDVSVLHGNVAAEKRYSDSFRHGCLYSRKPRSQKNCLCLFPSGKCMCCFPDRPTCIWKRGGGKIISSLKWLLNVKSRNLSLVI